MNHELVIDGNAFIQGSFQHCCIGIDDGKITEIKKILKGDLHHAFSKHILIPAGIDIHVHFREPGMTRKETFQTGTLAAAYGGISCVFDMPNTIPQTTTISALQEKISHATHHAVVDFGFHAGIADKNIESIVSLSSLANGFKIYLGSTTNSLLLSPSQIGRAFQQVEHTHLPVLCHAEDPSCLYQHMLIERTLSDHHKGRPPNCETKSIEVLLKEAVKYTTPIHICHISSKESVELLKNKPSNVTCGITPHHSLLNIDKLKPNDGRYKVNPPLRPKDHMTALFDSLKDGSTEIIESDHAPHLLDEKNVLFDEIPSGIPGVETMMPLFLSLAKKDLLSYQRLISLLSSRPAELIGVNKGRIEKGYDADIIAVDLKNDCIIKAEMLHSRCGWTPFEDWPAIFPEVVFIRGEKVIEHNEIQVNVGFGRFVRRNRSS
jgi:dihydroorotase